MNIPEFMKKRFFNMEGISYETCTFEKTLNLFRSFGGETKQLMTHQTEYY